MHSLTKLSESFHIRSFFECFLDSPGLLPKDPVSPGNIQKMSGYEIILTIVLDYASAILFFPSSTFQFCKAMDLLWLTRKVF